jgi:hypothetical protein
MNKTFCFVVSTILAAAPAFQAEAASAQCQPAGGEPVELKVVDHISASAKFAPKNAFSALIMFKVEVALPRGGIQRLLMNAGNGFYHGFRLNLVPEGDTGTYHPHLQIGQNGGAWALTAPDGSIKAGRWHRVAATWDGRTARIFVDGVEVASDICDAPYEPAPDRRAQVGVPGETYGIRTVPFFVERAAVATSALPADAVAGWAAGTVPFDPDTPEFPAALVRAEKGLDVSVAELDSFRAAPHTPLAILALDRAKAFALMRERRFAEAKTLAEDVVSRFRPMRYGPGMAMTFRIRMRELKMKYGSAADLLEDYRADYDEARAANAGHLPYVALTLMKALEKAGRTEDAARLGEEIKKMDLRRFPHLAEELGLKGEFTAHAQKGASVSRAMPKTAFHVSPTGDDAADGSATRPFRTLARARAAVRSLKAEGLPPGGVAVKLRGGVYKASETFELKGEADSGTPDRPIVWCAEGDDMPVFEGGFDVPPLKPVTDAAALARIPAAARAHVLCCDVRAAGYKHVAPQGQYGYYCGVVPVTDFFQDGARLTPARHPNDDWLRVEDLGVPSNTWIKTTLEDFRPWAAEPDLLATGFWKWFWADLTTHVTNVDVAAGALAIDVKCPRGGSVPIKRRQTFFLLNALCALDAPGEWFLDSCSGMLYVWPRGEAAGAKFTLTSFTGPLLKATGVHDVRVEGMVFQNGRGTGVEFADCREVVFAGNVVRRFGGNGMNAHRVVNATIRDNVFRSFGHGALEVSGGDRRTLAHSGNVISNNDFSDIENRRRTYAPHLHLAGVGAEVSFNHFHNSPSSAMRLEGNDFLIVSNLVEDVLLESDDQGGVDIYFNASYFGNRYCYNTWKNIGRQTDKLPCGQAAVRFDGNISGQTVVGNRFINCGTGHFGAIQSCGGRLHVIDNNLFVNCNRGMSINNYPTNYWFGKIRGTLIKPCLYDVCITNAPYATRYPGIADLLWTNQVSHLVRNVTVGDTPLLVNPPPPTVAYGNRHFAEMPDFKALESDATWRPIPEERDTGPRPTPLFLRARGADAAK